VPYQIEQAEPGIVVVTWSGAMTREDFIRAVQARRQYATRHNFDAYVLILDMSAVTIPIMDVRLARWSTYIDHRMQHVFIVGTPPVAQAVGNMLTHFADLKIDFLENSALARNLAHAVLSARAN
jgi:hypothetical protein